MNATLIAPQELVKRRVDGETIHLLDVRTPVEFREIHVEGSINVPARLSRRESCSFRRHGLPHLSDWQPSVNGSREA